LLVLAFGLLLVEEGNWGYDPLWIKLAFGGLAASFLIGAFVFGPGWTRLTKRAEAEGGASEAVLASVRRLVLVGYLDLGILAGTVFSMTVKPTADDAGALVVTAGLVAVSAAAGLVLYGAAARKHVAAVASLGSAG
jgi:hypothetical protein